MNPKKYDVFVIGSGIAGQTVAKRCAKAGLKVAIADNREFGGTCANRGCDPKKILLEFSDLMQQSERLKGLGISELPKIDWKDVQNFKDNFTQKVPAATENDLNELNIDLYYQSPKFTSKTQIEVEGKPISADKFVIATGLIPRKLTFKGSRLIKTSDDILNLDSIPTSAIFIGAGYVGMEFGNMLAALGCEVTFIEQGERSLKPFDPFLVEIVQKRLETLGVKFIFEADTTSVELLNKYHEVRYRKNDEEYSVKSEVVFNSSGRVPAVQQLELQNANIEADSSGIKVNEYLQSETNPAVYACGDVSSASLPLTPLSGLQGYIAGENIVEGASKTFKYPLVPSIVFVNPNLASVGYSEEEAKSRYKDIKIFKAEVPDWYNAKKNNTKVYAYKILVNARTNVIVGAHLLSPNAVETINLMVMAIETEMSIGDFKRLIFTYPSFSIDLKSMLEES